MSARISTPFLLFVCAGAVLLALPPFAAGQVPTTVGGLPSADPIPSSSASSALTAPTVAPPPHGLHPLPNNAMVPLKWMPPGSHASPVPSEEIFPPQELTLRFNHKLHIQQGLICKTCHQAAYTSEKATDRLLPAPTICDDCHDVDHRDLDRVVAGPGLDGECTYCHLGKDAGRDGRVAPLVIPPPNLRMNHRAHVMRHIGCSQCHGMVKELELATRQQLPRMAGCFTCHSMPAPSRGAARGACTTCHLQRADGRLATSFSTGSLLPPMWLHSAGHTPDFLQRHKYVAGANSELCASCHAEKECTACHDGRVRNRDVHPNDWLSIHAQAARFDNPRCVSCHQLQSFCADCHRRVGVAQSGPSANRRPGRRFHPPPREWTLAPRGPRHHAWEAQRNLNACVSCHSERDCVTCHATRGVAGGAGINPHPAGFRRTCRAAFRRNPRPCVVCHGPSDPRLSSCD